MRDPRSTRPALELAGSARHSGGALASARLVDLRAIFFTPLQSYELDCWLVGYPYAATFLRDDLIALFSCRNVELGHQSDNLSCGLTVGIDLLSRPVRR